MVYKISKKVYLDNCLKDTFPYVRLAEWSKAPDSSVSLPEYGHIEPSGPRMWAWVRIPHLTKTFVGKLAS